MTINTETAIAWMLRTVTVGKDAKERNEQSGN